MKPIGVVIPTRWEAAGILRRFPWKRFAPKTYQADLAGQSILLAISGVGADAARAAASRLCAAGVGELVSAGFCGALVPHLPIGTLVTHRLTSSNTPVKTAAERKALALKASAIAVDMETQAIVEAGTRKGVPIRMLRVISDGMEDDLTPLFGASGQFSVWGIALRLLNPALWPLALRLRRQSRVAATRLADSLADFLKQPH